MNGGTRFNSKKLRIDLIPASVIFSNAMVLTYGTAKYADRNWERGLSYMETVGSLLRHTYSWVNGEDLDSETGLPHPFHIQTNASFLSHFILFPSKYRGFDDRPEGCDAALLGKFRQQTLKAMEEAVLRFGDRRAPSGSSAT